MLCIAFFLIMIKFKRNNGQASGKILVSVDHGSQSYFIFYVQLQSYVIFYYRFFEFNSLNRSYFLGLMSQRVIKKLNQMAVSDDGGVSRKAAERSLSHHLWPRTDLSSDHSSVIPPNRHCCFILMHSHRHLQIPVSEFCFADLCSVGGSSNPALFKHLT